MFERYTDRARRVITLAQEEARMVSHTYIGTEHLLLGMLREDEGVAAIALKTLGISLEAARIEVLSIIGRGQKAPSGHIPFTPRAKKVMEYSLREALQLGHNYVGTEHLLLGIVREGEGVAVHALRALDVDLKKTREVVIQLLAGYQAAPEPTSTHELRKAVGVIATTTRSFELLERLHMIATNLGGISLADAADKVLTQYEAANEHQ